ncbi:hypothetical protein LOC67_11310 [Stieleria sp. JC731]|uniref:hypothetical protein n=1 Tax=Stieleria sp. JC731 TaxID=2894195 RepID=UPI001E5164E7|nr:hypothetical protein [Stieleria sp. JC731]MCC9601134.1 hypothetical protein [Stieleria sp. JC731]
MNVETIRNTIRTSTDEVQALILELHEQDPDNETFSQVGILNGSETVAEYLKHNELGVALDHLLYMIHESDIRYDIERVKQLHALAVQLNIRNHYTAENLRTLGVSNAHNVPKTDG